MSLSLESIEAKASLSRDGLQIAREFLDAAEATRIRSWIAAQLPLPAPDPDDFLQFARGASRIDFDIRDVGLLGSIFHKASKLAGSELVPLSAYTQIYFLGGYLPLHFDHPNEQVTVTITLDYASFALWPLFIIDEDRILSAMLDRGDALLFDSTRFPHCRNAFGGDSWIQMTAHFAYTAELSVV